MPKDVTSKLYIHKTTSMVIFVSLGVGVLGGICLWIAYGGLEKDSVGQSILKDIGSFLITSALFAIIWDLVSKRDFMNEIMSIAKISTDIEAAGIIGYNRDSRKIDWEKFFSETSSVAICFAYAETWRKHNEEMLKSFASKKNISVTILLPDPSNEIILQSLSYRFGQAPEDTLKFINNSIKGLTDIFNKISNFRIFKLQVSPVYSFYLFDNKVIVCLYKHRIKQNIVPAIIGSKGGFLYEFVKSEYDACITEEDIAIQLGVNNE